MRFATIHLLVLGIASSTRADDGLPADVLERVKNATVFVKTSSGPLQRTGSGFLFSVDGTTGLIATNEHVVTDFARDDLPRTEVKVVFGSGLKGEMSADGVVVAVDKEADIAIIRVGGVKGLPKGLDIAGASELRETMSIYAAGFPFGKALSLTKGSPAVSISKGSVSSLRKNDRDELSQIQIEGTLNPGNSGGPVVDSNGRLIGIAVARIPGANIGIAVPRMFLMQMLEGRSQKVTVRVGRVTNGVAQVDVSVALIDPLDKVQKVSILVARNDSFEEFKSDKSGQWLPLKGGQAIVLKVGDRVATGSIALKSSERSVAYFTIQPVFDRTDKVRVHTSPLTPFRVDFRTDTAANLPTAPFRSKAIDITSKASGDWLFKEVRRGTPLFSDSEFVLSEIPKEIVGATLLVRKSAEHKAWLEPYAINALVDGSVYGLMRTKSIGKEEVSEVVLSKLEREGWTEVKGSIETTFPDGEDWRWTVLRKPVKKGEIVLQLKTVRWPDAPVLFAFKADK